MKQFQLIRPFQSRDLTYFVIKVNPISGWICIKHPDGRLELYSGYSMEKIKMEIDKKNFKYIK